MSPTKAILGTGFYVGAEALESFLASKRNNSLPAAIFSGLIFLICLGLYLFVDRIDTDVRNSGADR